MREGHLNVMHASRARSIPPRRTTSRRRSRRSEEEGRRRSCSSSIRRAAWWPAPRTSSRPCSTRGCPSSCTWHREGAWAGSAGVFITMAGHVAAMAPGLEHRGGPPGRDRRRRCAGSAGEDGEQKPAGLRRDRRPRTCWSPSSRPSPRSGGATSSGRAGGARVRGRHRRRGPGARRDRSGGGGPRRPAAPDRAAPTVEFDGEDPVDAGPEPALRSGDRDVDRWSGLINVIVEPQRGLPACSWRACSASTSSSTSRACWCPGSWAGICLLLALIAMQILPFSWLGLLLLIVVGVALFVAETLRHVLWRALRSPGRYACCSAGSMLFDKPELSDLDISFWSVLVPRGGDDGLRAPFADRPGGGPGHGHGSRTAGVERADRA